MQHELQYQAPSWKAGSLPILKYSGGGHVMHCSVGGSYNKNKQWGTRQAISPASLQQR